MDTGRKEPLNILISIEDADWQGKILTTKGGHIVVVTDESDGIYIPHEVLKQYKTQFYRLQTDEGKITLTPAKLHLELMEGEDKFQVAHSKSQEAESGIVSTDTPVVKPSEGEVA